MSIALLNASRSSIAHVSFSISFQNLRSNPAFKDLSIRAEYCFYKYFLQWIEPLFPHHFCKNLKVALQIIYWDIKHHVTFYPWLKNFKTGVNAVKLPMFDDKAQVQAVEFIASPEFQKLRSVCPLVDCIHNDKRVSDMFDLSGGTCLGQSLVAMKYHSYFTTDKGFKGFEAANRPVIKNQVAFLQTLHQIQNKFKVVMELKKKLEAKNISPEELCSPDNSVDDAKLFHALRSINVSRVRAFHFTNAFPSLFKFSSEELKQKISLCDQMTNETAVPIEQASSLHLNPKKLSTENKNNTQKEMDHAICQFLCQNSGRFLLASGGAMNAGHAMFLKVENGKCLTFDPGTKISFITAQNSEGIAKTLELMKRILSIKLKKYN
jgi:hypothetical protein